MESQERVVTQPRKNPAMPLPEITLQHVQVGLQAISSLAIGGGFIFAAYQFWQHRRAQMVTNFTKIVELQMQLRRMRVDDPSLAAVYQHDVSGRSSPQEVREYFMNLMQLSLFEIVWYANKKGQLSDDYFESWFKRMREIEQEESFIKMMTSPSMKIFHDDFQQYIQTQLNDVLAKRGRTPVIKP
jgi:hypothetical protein